MAVAGCWAAAARRGSGQPFSRCTGILSLHAPPFFIVLDDDDDDVRFCLRVVTVYAPASIPEKEVSGGIYMVCVCVRALLHRYIAIASIAALCAAHCLSRRIRIDDNLSNVFDACGVRTTLAK